MEKIIEVNDVYKSYGKKQVLKGINLTVNVGERVAILGANGCGKSTLVDMIALTDKPTKGTIKINIDKPIDDVKKEIGIQFQQGEWPAGISANDMLSFYKKIYPRFTESRDKQLREVFGINEYAKQSLRSLSGGQKQRFNAMVSVLNDPKIVILDELTTGLDMELQYRITNYFVKTSIAENQTMLIVSHHPEEVEALCTRVVIIHDGIIFFDDSLENINKKYKSVSNLMDLYFGGKLTHDKIESN